MGLNHAVILAAYNVDLYAVLECPGFFRKMHSSAIERWAAIRLDWWMSLKIGSYAL